MTTEETELMLQLRIRPKSSSWVMSAIGRVSTRFAEDFWTTWRWPFGESTIYYPSRVLHPAAHKATLRHELVHVEQQRKWYGPWLTLALVTIFPLPVFFSGRWIIERDAYLLDIKSKRITVTAAIDLLWDGYGAPWPKKLMRRWFISRLK